MKSIYRAIVLLLTTATALSAQIIQQPVVGVDSVRTSVSVPDRGSAFLGGVSRAYSASNRYGFSPFGSAGGRGASNSSQRVFVTIHDFEEADRQLLSIAKEKEASRPDFRNPRAKQAWKQLTSNRR